MSQSQIERWAQHHNCPRTGKIFEIPFFTYILPRVGVALAFAGAISYFNPILFWNYKPPDLEPEFQAEVAKIGNVAVSGRCSTGYSEVCRPRVLCVVVSARTFSSPANEQFTEMCRRGSASVTFVAMM